MARARGANVQAALAFADSYGDVPANGFFAIAGADLGDLGDSQALLDDDLIGKGREALPPGDDTITNTATFVVPVDVRNVGLWLKLLFGAPTTTQGLAATGAIAFAANPANNDTITVGGQAFTFKSANPAANQILIGATLQETVRNAVWALNASTVAGVIAARYSTDRDAEKIQVTHKTIGTSGNAFAIAASVATASGATLAGGSATGPYNHVFTSGALALPDAAIEIGHPEVPAYHMNYGVMGNTGSIPLQRSGNLNLSLGVIAQGEQDPTTSSQAGTLTDLAIERFAQGAGDVLHLGVPLGELVSGEAAWSNNLDVAENIRPDGRIDGADPGKFTGSPRFTVRYKDLVLYNLAKAKQELDLAYRWIRSAYSLEIRYPAVRVPRPKKPISGPGGVQMTYEGQAYRHATLGKTMIVTLVNDVPSYA